MEMTKLSCEQFLAELAGKAPTPGGGGTAALVGAAGVALGNMVGNLTTGKKKYAAVEADIQALNTKADFLRKELEALVQADADAFAHQSRLHTKPPCWKRRWMPPVPCHLRSWKSAPRALLWWKNTPPRAA